MVLKAIAVKAVKWLRRLFSWYRHRDDEVKYVIGVIKRLGIAPKLMGKMAARLEKVERTTGARTDAWGKIHRARQNKKAVVLDAADTKYLDLFKQGFDTLKKPFK